ncbi:tryptophan synthase subunit alpha [Arthrobacter bambusae]|uniref:Tryptophan synthase alpha chain n=1 Tax=Arthrobacter bambusae TaxID=1338426 RepID=A0AAW8DKH5_9MICC|nr:tryptophan synthase subunit alpha [Arthrobacter bambusae]MDP9906189.1 tryptophan synthase alpha chain [Arthrobacter bambusae]MDQ0130578.1 tryptophan synthase alpha chain [Arthrobacter bambusae]MDQ0182253.1 tryptophan synthase alpha chain [Arthrobacter bambusae]
MGEPDAEGASPKRKAVSRAAAAIDRAKAEGRAALVGYLPAGYPSVQGSIEAAIELARNGADIIEIGIPYSDPVMDGTLIQAATTEALANGFRVASVFDVVKAVSEATDAAVLVMTYWNPVARLGVDEFARRLAEAGGAGIITPDLIPDEAAEWLEASEKYGLDRVFLVAPSTSPDRMAMTVAATRGFTYAVSLMGVTGARETVDESARRVVAAARDAGAERVCVGLGISHAGHVREIAAYADGVIVGTAIVAALRRGGPAAVGRLAAELRAGLVPGPAAP